MSNTNGWMRPAAGVGAAVIVVAIGATLYLARPMPGAGPETEPASKTLFQNQADAPAAVVDLSTPPPAPDATPETASDIAEVGTQVSPAFDLVRIPPDGLATVAGRAEPGATVKIVVDGAEVTRTEASARGEFVALFELPASGEAREMRLLSQSATEGAEEVSSAETVLIAPASAPPKRPIALGDETDLPPDMKSRDGVTGTAESVGVAVATQVLEATGQRSAPEADPQPDAEHQPDDRPTVLMANDEGVKVLQQAGTTPAELRIDAITYDPEGRVFVSGRAVPEAALLIYLDGAFWTEARAGADGQWRRELADVAAGRYTLRVDQIAEGAVVSRVESPFQREEIAKLAEIASGSSEAAAPSSETPTEAATSEEKSRPKPRIASVTVQPGNTLWGIASERYGDGYLYIRLFDANRAQIRDPDLIYPGQIFDIPE